MKTNIQYISDKLKGLYPPEEIQSFIRLILEEVCHFSSTDFILHKNMILSPFEQEEIMQIVERLRLYEPIQYVFGHTWFYGNRFEVTPNVLIPRPETEELVEKIISDHRGKSGRLLDIGTGSGCIAISLALHLREMQVEGWDVSLDALTVARENARNLNAWVAFRVTDILNYDADEGISEQYDIWVSNPPYICRKEAAAMSENVIEYEPHTALFVEDHDPLLFYRVIGEAGLKQLVPGGFLYFEINALFGNECADLLNKIGYEKIEVIKDISKRDRFVIARKPLNKTL